MLGLKDEAEKYAVVLEHNYPQGSWIQGARNLLK